MLTQKQKETLDFIEKHIKVSPPSLGEIRKGLGLNSRQAALSRLKILQQKGYLDEKYMPRKS